MPSLSSDYLEHVDILKQLKMSDSFYKAREPYKEDFEKIYSKAKEENVSLSTAKDFLNSLSIDDLSTLQNYTLLVNKIDIDSLSDEGAYNLLLHHYEKYDFNNDGYIQNGDGKNTELIPKNLPTNEKQALVNSLNEMDEKARFLSMALTFPPKIDIDGFVADSYNESESYNFKNILARIDRVLNPLPGEYRSKELLDIFETLRAGFEENYNKIKEQKEVLLSSINSSSTIVKAKIES